MIFELWCTIAIGLLSLILTVLSSKGQLFDNRNRWYKRLSKRGTIVIFLGILIVFLSAIQYWMIDKRNAEKDEAILELQRTISQEVIVRKDSDLKYLRASLREYDELVIRYYLQMSSIMSSFSMPMKHEVLQLDNFEFRTRWNELAATGNNILKISLVSGNDALYSKWQTLNTEVFTTFMFCLTPTGQLYYEPSTSYEVTLAMKREKLKILNKRFQEDVNNENGAIGLLIKGERDKLR